MTPEGGLTGLVWPLSLTSSASSQIPQIHHSRTHLWAFAPAPLCLEHTSLSPSSLQGLANFSSSLKSLLRSLWADVYSALSVSPTFTISLHTGWPPADSTQLLVLEFLSQGPLQKNPNQEPRLSYPAPGEAGQARRSFSPLPQPVLTSVTALITPCCNCPGLHRNTICWERN